MQVEVLENVKGTLSIVFGRLSRLRGDITKTPLRSNTLPIRVPCDQRYLQDQLVLEQIHDMDLATVFDDHGIKIIWQHARGRFRVDEHQLITRFNRLNKYIETTLALHSEPSRDLATDHDVVLAAGEYGRHMHVALHRCEDGTKPLELRERYCRRIACTVPGHQVRVKPAGKWLGHSRSRIANRPMPRNTPERLNGVQVTLASSSRHRAAQLRQLVIDFDTVSPDVDETAGDSESVNDLVTRLGLAKAQAALVQAPGRVLIASDQSAAFTLGDSLQRLGKPGTPEAAIRQLHDLSGKEVTFLTSLVVLDDRSGGTPTPTVDVDVTQVRLRHLSTAEIERYVARDDVLDCAGAFRVESLGIALFEHIRSDDPTALVGLPLIRLAARLRDCGLAIP